VHVFDNLSPSDPGIVGAEGNFPFLRSVRDDAHFGTAKIICPKVLEPHPFNAQHSPVVALAPILHAIIPIAVWLCGIWFKQVNDLLDRESLGCLISLIVSHDRKSKLHRGELLPACCIRDYGHVSDELLIVKELVEWREFMCTPVNDQERENTAVRMTVARTPSPRGIRSLQQVHYAGERAV
jgi:hypothetical protein